MKSIIQHIEKKIYSLEKLKLTLLMWRNDQNNIIFTNGCFDLIHFGHIKCLIDAKSFGGKLVVGLNSDISIKNLKGNNRPLKDQKTRSFILASMEFIDAIIIFDTITPENLIKEIKPDILIKGGDYKNKKIIGSDIVKEYGGITRTVSYVDDQSSSTLINKISISD